MSRHRHDLFSKELFRVWLAGLGDVRLDAHIAGEARRGDVLFRQTRDDPALRKQLGRLGDLARGTVLFEPFRNPPTLADLESCVVKRAELDADAWRQARRAAGKTDNEPTVKRSVVCVVAPSLSGEIKRACGVSPRASGGVYRLSELLGVVLVVVNELPVGRETLWLRLLGRGVVQRRALSELTGLRESGELKDATMGKITAWRASLPPSQDLTSEERELMTYLEKVYKRWEKKVKTEGWLEGKAAGKAEGLAAGKAEGEAAGKALAVLSVLQARGLTVPASVQATVSRCTDQTQLDAWVKAAVTVTKAADLLTTAPRKPRAAAAPRAPREPAARKPAARKPAR